MLGTLIYNVRFPNGRSFDREIEFKDGLTAIVGKNEQGKSLTLEMIRFCLFGSAALRGTADDYEHLQASLTFTARGETRHIVRTTKGAVLSIKGGETEVRGTKPVNARIIEILGFDLDVFDVACAANQGDVERLAQMKPTARREMVDRLIGADRIEEIVNWTAEEALGLKREIDVLQRELVEPVEPVKPEDWQSADGLRAAIAEQQERREEMAQIQAWMSTRPSVPEVPAEPPHSFTRKVLDQAEEVLGHKTYDFNIEQVKDQWAQYETWVEFDKLMTEIPPPLPGVTVEIATAKLEILRLDKELTALRKSPKLCCPQCDHMFTLADNEVNTIVTQIAEQEKIVDKQKTYAAVISTCEDWPTQLRRATHWAKPEIKKRYAELAGTQKVDRPAITRGQIEDAELPGSLDLSEQKALLEGLGLGEATLSAVRILRRQLDQFEAAVEAAGPAKTALAAWLDLLPSKEKRLETLRDLVVDLPKNRALLESIVIYDTMMLLHKDKIADYQFRKDEIEQKMLERQSWLMGKEQLNALRLKLKSFLAPSLSQAASALLAQMTNGARRSIWVSDAFEIEVDGQKLQTLSGSGKVCANLALRIGLAQVLTNNVLSVFIGDEMDAFMDMERVEALNGCLERLSGRIGQIIIITHKPPVFKNIINFGG